MRAERRLGEMIRAQKETVGLAKGRAGPGRGKAGAPQHKMATDIERAVQHVRSIWWLLVWRGTIGGTVLGALAGAIAGVVITVIGGTPDAGEIAGRVAGGFAGFVWGFFVVYMAVKKKYRGFRIALIPHSPDEVLICRGMNAIQLL